MENVFSKECKCCGQKKTIDHFKKTRWGGYVSVCTECANQKRHDNRVKKQQEKELEKARVISAAENKQKILESFTPRELMKELSRRGYKGHLSFTQTIDICNF
jgi:ribosome-binding protein aMBF1 (putative translation factor)